MPYSSQPIDILDNDNNWLASYRYEKFLSKWFYVENHPVKSVSVAETDLIPGVIKKAADIDTSTWNEFAYCVPQIVQIQLNAHCNYQCPMCYASSLRGKPLDTDFTLEELDDLFYKLKKWGVLRVDFVGGEIFMRPDIEEIVGMAQRNRLLVSCITNARIPGKNIEKYSSLLKRFFNVQVSCNGTGEFYAVEYQMKNWEDASKSISNVIKAVNKSSMSFIITENNYNNLLEFLEYASYLKPDLVKIGVTCHSGRSKSQRNSEYYNSILPIAKKEIEKGRLKFPDLNITSQLDLIQEIPEWDLMQNNYRPIEFYISPDGRETLYIAANGDLYPFPLVADNPELKLGNVHVDDIKRVWSSSSILKKIREVTFSNSVCGKIGCKSVCGLWSRSYAVSWSNDIYGKTPCELTEWS